MSSVAEVKAFYKKLLLQEPLHLDVVRESMAILEGSKALSKPTERKIDPAAPKNRAAVLNEVETSICTFDLEQKRAALHTLDAAQRIRGLAGSGKTIILAMKAAQIHLQHPDAEILYTFYTKSLYGLIKEQITRFYRSFSDRDPDWTKIHILHAWGGRNLPGVYWSVCRNHGVNSIPFGEAKQFSNPFDHVCELLLKQPLKQMYDYALLDEAQDFPKHFYRLCRAVTKNSRVIWGYDECQNILDVTIQDTKETFGKDDGGKYHLDFSKLPASSLQDLVLHVCYRNPRKVLFCAFAIGLGLYGDRIIQMLENNEHWEDLGFEVSEGNSKTGDTMVIVRPERNSPLVKNQLLESDDVVRVSVCKDLDDESKFVSEQIERDIREGLFPQDILVISLDDRNARTYFSVLATRLRKKGIVSFNSLDAATTSTAFKVQGSVTLTTVYRAKGNEAGSVYIVGVDSVFAERKSIIARNKLFTALTRAKAWVTVSGIGEDAQACANEINKALKSYPELRFKMPDKKSLRMFQRDLEKGQAELNLIERQLGELSQRMGMDVGELIETISKKTTRKK